jgi:hypothetical protein
MSRVDAIVSAWPSNIKVSAEVRNQKLSTCNSCEYAVVIPEKEIVTCGKCSCDMVLLTWSTSMGTCPIGKFHGEAL